MALRTVAFVSPFWRFAGAPAGDCDLGRGVQLGRIEDLVPRSLKLVHKQHSPVVEHATFCLARDHAGDDSAVRQSQPTAFDSGGPRWPALKVLTETNLAVWLAKPSGLSFRFVLEFKRDTESSEGTDVPPLISLLQDAQEMIHAGDLRVARRLNESIGSVRPSSALSTALEALWRALVEESVEVRYLLLWVVLEALFGPAEGREVSYRLAQRIALFTSQDAEKREARSRRLRDLYRIRSQIVHGRRAAGLSEEKAIAQLLELEATVRLSLGAILESRELVSTFSSRRGRESLLESLVFHGSA